MTRTSRIPRRIPSLPPALFLTDAARIADPVNVAGQLPRGYGVILRDYRLPGRKALARELSAVCRERGLRFLVGADVRLAREVGADGLHLPRWAQSCPVLGSFTRGFLLTASVHSQAELAQATALGADAALVSPVFPTKGVPAADALGLAGFLRLLRVSALPCYALGGITRETARSLPAHTKLAGIAGISLFANAL
jgi:thiamine-phosphate pyrophosphorylase